MYSCAPIGWLAVGVAVKSNITRAFPISISRLSSYGRLEAATYTREDDRPLELMGDHVQRRRVDGGLRGLSKSMAVDVVARKVGPPWIVIVPGVFSSTTQCRQPSSGWARGPR